MSLPTVDYDEWKKRHEEAIAPHVQNMREDFYAPFASNRDAIDRSFGAAEHFIGDRKRYHAFAPKERMGAEGQAWEGIAKQQAAMQAMANRRGYNPAMARASAGAGAELESRGWGLAEQMRALEEQRRKEMILAALQKRSDAELMQQQTDLAFIAEGFASKAHMDQMARAYTQMAEQSQKNAAMGVGNAAAGMLTMGMAKAG